MTRRHFDWRLPVYTGVAAALVVVSIALTNWFDFGEMGYFFLVAPVVTFILLVRALMSNRLPRLTMLVSYLLVTFVMFKVAGLCRTYGRWLLSGNEYRKTVLAEPEPAAGDFRHVVWDGWGFAGSDTDVYLVFDASDTLAQKVRESKNGKVNQYLCGVSRLNRLQARWFSVVFYTNEGWGDCK